MVYTAILAGGIGRRMKNSNIPKQFIKINDIPIIVVTVKRILESDKVRKVIVAVQQDWIEYCKELLSEYFENDILSEIDFICGGKERLDSFENIANHVKKYYGVNADDILLCHEAVRPFVSIKMVDECIDKALEHGVAATFVPVNDTIFVHDSNNNVVNSEDRSNQLQGQTPSAFNLNLLLKIMADLSNEERIRATSTTQLFLDKGFNIPVVEGAPSNFKITTNMDIIIANEIMKEGIHSV